MSITGCRYVFIFAQILKKGSENYGQTAAQNIKREQNIAKYGEVKMSDKCVIDPERECLGLMKARELEKDLKDLIRQNRESHERFFERLELLEKQEGIQGEQYKHIMEKLDRLSGDVKELKAKPAKRWESIVEKVLGLVIAAVVGFALARLGLQ